MKAILVLQIILALTLRLHSSPRCKAQTQAPLDAEANVAAPNEPAGGGSARRQRSDRHFFFRGIRASRRADPAISAVEQELAAMKVRIEQLEAELKTRTAQPQPRRLLQCVQRPTLLPRHQPRHLQHQLRPFRKRERECRPWPKNRNRRSRLPMPTGLG